MTFSACYRFIVTLNVMEHAQNKLATVVHYVITALKKNAAYLLSKKLQKPFMWKIFPY